MYGYICPVCGAYLDPGETCDCEEEREKNRDKLVEAQERLLQLIAEEEDGQLKIAI